MNTRTPNPLEDDDYTDNDPQIEDLKGLVIELSTYVEALCVMNPNAQLVVAARRTLGGIGIY